MLTSFFYADVRLCEYISYCLSQLSYTDKSMRKLIELFKTYEHSLSEDSVMDNFRIIISKVRFAVASQDLDQFLAVIRNSFHCVEPLLACLNVFNQGKKFAKPELRSCIEEFAEKLNKFHIERKEQELTAKNAQSHQQKVESLESIVVTETKEDEIGESEITEGRLLQVYFLFIQLLLFLFYLQGSYFQFNFFTEEGTRASCSSL